MILASHDAERSLLFVNRFWEYGGFVYGVSDKAKTMSGLHE